jgi:uncharacterized tellurite resistance protein B-like protein
MFKKLLEIISTEKRSKTEQIDSNIIFASLLVRAARIDNEYSDVEKQQIDLIIKEKFLVPISKAQEIRTYAEEFEQNIVDTVQITKKIKKNIPFEERQVLAEDLWSIILADSTRSEDENSFMRTCIKLIGVNDVDSAIARRAVIDKNKKKQSLNLL